MQITRGSISLSNRVSGHVNDSDASFGNVSVDGFTVGNVCLGTFVYVPEVVPYVDFDGTEYVDFDGTVYVDFDP